MSVRFTNQRLDYFLDEDIPYVDLTTEVLGIGERNGSIEFFTREDCVLCGVEQARRILRSLDCEVTFSLPAGTRLSAGDAFLAATGTAAALHQAWKVCLNLCDHLSAVATKTRAMVDAVHAANPECEVVTTRKNMPGAKDLLIDAVITGGAFPHRLGLSETVLVFDNHITFMGGFDAFLEKLPEIRSRCIEKKLFVEATVEQAEALAKAGVDGIQLDKAPADEIALLVERIRSIDPRITLIAAGGINPGNAAEYAATGIDGIATTSLYTAKPIDMSARFTAL